MTALASLALPFLADDLPPCVDHVATFDLAATRDSDIEHRDGATGSRVSQAITTAKAVCAACRCRIECLDFALATAERYGVWGGLDAHQRDRVRRGRPADPVRPIPSTPIPADAHGTRRGYLGHRRRREPACDPCREAERVYTAARRAKESA